MRILKPIKSSESNFQTGNENESDELVFTVEQIDLNQQDGTLDWLNKTSLANKLNTSDKKSCKPTKTVLDQNECVDSVKSEFNRLFNKGIRLLSMREHSKHEIITKLSVKCETLDIVYAVVDFLIENKYQSDNRFTECYVRFRRNRGFGPNKIKSELKNKGINNIMIEDHLNVTSVIWFDNARDQYQKKYGSGPIKDYNTWAKRARFMQSRGFSMEHIQITLPSVDHD